MSSTPRTDQASTFTPIHPFEMDQPKTCDKIVFSKRSLLEFLKSAGITVNQNFSEIQKLPKYATFGRFSQAATDAAVADLVDAEIGDPTTDSTVKSSQTTVPRPSRKVIDPPGGKQSIRLFGEEYEEEDALSLAPPRDGGDGVDVEVERLERLRVHAEPVVDGGARIEDDQQQQQGDGSRISNPPAGYRPSRKVREGPGGASQMGAALFGGFEGETEEDRASSRAPQGGKKQVPQGPMRVADSGEGDERR
ncbi:hypothetical protein I317_00631 [Kwoniella heveanensis CBS 569]|uniref:Uncharacterized protein n=1 Tax=Kwoniella heveanensis BCC8398 TaxID=1296120 RepID=A0A1B9H038_9TREE|nr:hypothetical protein I316_01882 [Kwoniella heveanensis BCC8398]OCF45386.1 hypothetical protein I317_00631 [Kwoniella heveanensis CBS 569]